MKLKIVFGMLALLAGFSVISAGMYKYHGVIEEQVRDENVVVIDGDRYFMDNKTIIHGMVQRGENGPIFADGQKLGFNFEVNRGMVNYISEGWLLK